MNKTRLLLIISFSFQFFLAVNLLALDTGSHPAVSIGITDSLQSKLLGENRQLYIYLPPSYETTKATFPVVYLLDGAYAWHFKRAVASLESLVSQDKAPECIIVGLDGINGVRDYFPTPLPNRPGSGQADRFQAFITSELKPYISSKYRTADYTILCGGSNAGLFTLYTYFSRPDLFNSFIAASPSIGFAPETMRQFINTWQDNETIQTSSAYVNYADDDIPSLVNNYIDSFFIPLETLAQNIPSLVVELIPDGGHVPFISIYRGLALTFSDWGYSREKTLQHGLTGLRDHFQTLSKKYGMMVLPPEESLTSLAVQYYRENKFAEAIDVLDFTIGCYPESVRAYYVQGLVWEKNGDPTKAINAMKQALLIDSTYTRAADKLKEWEKNNN